MSVGVQAGCRSRSQGRSAHRAKSWPWICKPACCSALKTKRRPQTSPISNFSKPAVGEGKLGRNRFDRSLLVTVLGEIPDREAALREIFDALKPGGILSVTEVIFDPQFQSRPTVVRLARSAGFREKACHGNRIAFTFNFEKPTS